MSSGSMGGAVASSYPSDVDEWTAQAIVVVTGATGSITVMPWVLCSQ